MTIGNQPSRVEFEGDGVSATFDYPHYFRSKDDLRAAADGVLLTIASVTGANDPAGGTVTFSTVPANGAFGVIRQLPILSQSRDFNTGDDLPADSFEGGLDKLTLIAQAHEDRLARTPSFSDWVDIGALDPALPAPVAGGVARVKDDLSGWEWTDSADIVTLADIADDIAAVAAIAANVTTVAGVAANVTTVAGVAGAVAALGPVAAAVSTVAGVAANVTTVAGVAASVAALGPIAAAISGVNAIAANVSTVAGVAANVTTVAGVASAVSVLGPIAAAITGVNNIAANVSTVAGIAANVTTLAGISAAISTVAGLGVVGVLNGSGAPGAGLGVNGNFYIDTTGWKIYGPKAAGAWPAGVNLVGPAGAGSGDMLAANNLSDLVNAATARTNLGMSANASSLVTAANYAAMRTLLSLVPGTDFYSKTAADAQFVPFGGGTLTGALTLNADPTNALHAATKQYVDNLTAGLDVKASVRAATTGALPSCTYSAGVLTATANGALAAQDGVTLLVNEDLLVKDQASALQNGIYRLTQVGTGGTPFILTRRSDMDTWAEVPGANVWVEEGTANGDRAYVCTSNTGGTLGTTAITWTIFGGSGAYQAASSNLTTWAGIAPSANMQSLAAAANYGAMRTLLALVPGTDFVAYGSFSANALTMIGHTFAQMRTDLGLVIGTDVEAHNSKLTNFAASSNITGTITVSTAAPSGGADGDIWLERAA